MSIFRGRPDFQPRLSGLSQLLRFFICGKSDTIKKGIIFNSIFEPFFDRFFTGQTTGIGKIPNFRRIWMGPTLYISLCAAFFGRGMRLYIQDIKPLKWLYMASELKA